MSHSTFEKALTAKPEFSGVSGHMVGETGVNAGNSLAVDGGTLCPECGSILDRRESPLGVSWQCLNHACLSTFAPDEIVTPEQS